MLDTLFQQAPIGLAFFDRERRYVRINQCLADKNGATVEAHIGRTPTEVLGEAAAGLEALLGQVFETAEAIPPFEIQADEEDAPDGGRWWLVNVYPVSGDDGLVELVDATVAEITGRKRMELALAESQERLALATRVRTALGPAAAQALAMAIHELTTNAVKYGALSSPEGRVDVAWRRGERGVLRIQWLEQGGPKVTVPVRRGLGSSILERSLAGPLGGVCRLDWRPGGLVCELELPYEAAVAELS